MTRRGYFERISDTYFARRAGRRLEGPIGLELDFRDSLEGNLKIDDGGRRTLLRRGLAFAVNVEVKVSGVSFGRVRNAVGLNFSVPFDADGFLQERSLQRTLKTKTSNQYANSLLKRANQ